MLSPELELWVAGELSKGSATLKERRKIAEARGLPKVQGKR